MDSPVWYSPVNTVLCIIKRNIISANYEISMIIIIGTGLAGYQTAREFRKLNAQTPVTIITQDDGRFYPKPQLSTALTQKKTSAMLATADAEAMAKQLNATILTQTKVHGIDPKQQIVTTSTHQLFYDQLVIACGADTLNAPLSGNAVGDALSINHIYHYAEFEKLILGKKEIAILGAGLIGCEFANDLSNAGYHVHVIAPDHYPLERFLPEKIGELLQQALIANGVKFHLKTTAVTLDKTDDHYILTLADQSRLQIDFVLSAIGLKPHIDLARQAGIKTERGILVNRFLETNFPHIYALGDCAEVEGHVLPFITPILNCARALAKTLAGERTSVDYPAMPVTVKTPAHPIVICPPPLSVHGHWTIEINDQNARALFYDENNQLYGFVLTNEAVKERMNLSKLIPRLF